MDSFAQTEKWNQGAPAKEGPVTKEVEKVTSQIPSGAYLAMALGSMALSAGIAAFGKKKTTANFIGLWVPTLLLIGIYNKIVKVNGSERQKPFSRQDFH